MSNDRIERIRDRAHEIWEREGQPEGRDVEHWQQAAVEVEAEDAARAAGAPAPAAKPAHPDGAPASAPDAGDDGAPIETGGGTG